MLKNEQTFRFFLPKKKQNVKDTFFFNCPHIECLSGLVKTKMYNSHSANVQRTNTRLIGNTFPKLLLLTPTGSSRCVKICECALQLLQMSAHDMLAEASQCQRRAWACMRDATVLTPCREAEEAGSHRGQVEGEGSRGHKHRSLCCVQGHPK